MKSIFSTLSEQPQHTAEGDGWGNGDGWEGGGGWCELHCHTPFSLRTAGSSIEALVGQARALGMPALAITDTMTLAGVVRFHTACRAAGIRPITGCELTVQHPPEDTDGMRDMGGEAGAVGMFIALARDRTGYANLCELLTRANLRDPQDRRDRQEARSPEQPYVTLDELAVRREGLLLLAGGCDGLVQRLLVAGQVGQARAVLTRYRALFGEALYLELRHLLLPESALLLARSALLAAEVGVRCAATNGARYAVSEDMRVLDVLTCVRHRLHVGQAHPARPRNAEQYLKDEAALRRLFASCLPASQAAAAFGTAAALAARCAGAVALLAERCMPPRLPSLPAGETPATYLRRLCEDALPARYPVRYPAHDPAEQAQVQVQARRQLDHELGVIGELGLDEFFLVVWDIMREARERGIRCAGRGSAANSLVAYLLGITAVDPLVHHLLFERFLNVERAGMPDIDVDVASSRREELIRYVEATYSERHAAMVANVVTYRPRLALRDAAQVLGFPMPLVGALTRRLPHFGHCEEIGQYADELAQVVEQWVAGADGAGTADGGDGTEGGDGASGACWQDRLQVALELVPRLEGFPRHLSLHNGGMLLTREPLTRGLVVRRSANGVRCVELDKDDCEALGYIKFDLLGLRTFDAIEHTLDLIAETEQTNGKRLPIDDLPLDPPDGPDAATMELVRSGQTLAVFQVESPAQWHLLAETQPETFDELVIQTALCRPGPIQAGMVHPYIARRQAQRQGRTSVTYAHPALEPVLRDTLGIVLYQEQVLEIAHVIAGLTYGEADGFRKAMTHYRTTAEMEGMRAQFVGGAQRQGIALAVATRIFDEIACFVGYGFCRSHAAAFARTIYQTAWLKAHWPAHYLAGFLSAQPAGFFPPATVVEEAKHLGIPVLPVDVQQSGVRFTVELVHGMADAPGGGRGGSNGRNDRDGRNGKEDGARYAIRIGLTQVKGVGEEVAGEILAERVARGPYRSLAEFCTRVGRRMGGREEEGQHLALKREAVETLVAAGAFDALGIPRRRLLWLLGEHWSAWQAGWQLGRPKGRTRVAQKPDKGRSGGQAALPWEWPDEQAGDAPRLPHLTLEEEVAVDLATQGLSPRPHPLTFRRRWLTSKGVVPIAGLATMAAGGKALLAGQVVSAQRPPTAKGVAFLVLEDETGRVQVVVPLRLTEDLRVLLAESRLLALSGRVERSGQLGQHVTVLAHALRALPPVEEQAVQAEHGEAASVRRGRADAREDNADAAMESAS